MPRTRSAAATALAVLVAVLVLGAAPASAHVTLVASSTAAGATAVLRMEVPHGCGGSATTEVAVRAPTTVTDLAAEDTQRWDARVTADGVTFRTDEPLPDGMRDEVVLTVRLPDEVGAELVFPVVQRCEAGESAWTEVAGGGASGDELDMPAPVIVVTAADGSIAEAAAMSYGAAGLLGVACLGSGIVLLLRRRRA